MRVDWELSFEASQVPRRQGDPAFEFSGEVVLLVLQEQAGSICAE